MNSRSSVNTASLDDVPAWLRLASEVESLFGPLVDNPAFVDALHRHISRGTALCVRNQDGTSGTPLQGGILYSPAGSSHAEHRISWLAVAAKWQRHGIGRQLVESVIALMEPPRTIAVVTFGADVPEGLPARRFYERLGFHPEEDAPRGPEGGSRQVFRRSL